MANTGPRVKLTYSRGGSLIFESHVDFMRGRGYDIVSYGLCHHGVDGDWSLVFCREGCSEVGDEEIGRIRTVLEEMLLGDALKNVEVLVA